MAPPLNVLTLNCKGLNNVVKAKRITNYLTRERSNVVFLQETHQKSSSYKLLKSKWFEQKYLGSSKSRGVAMILSKGLQISDVQCLKDTKGLYLFINYFE